PSSPIYRALHDSGAAVRLHWYESDWTALLRQREKFAIQMDVAIVRADSDPILLLVARLGGVAGWFIKALPVEADTVVSPYYRTLVERKLIRAPPREQLEEIMRVPADTLVGAYQFWDLL